MKDERDDAAENTAENTGDRCPENLKPYRWQKGQPSPNPGGRPKKAPISEAYEHHVTERLTDDIRRRFRLRKGATWADAIAVKQIHAALRGNTVAAKEIADRIEGRVRLPVAVETPEGEGFRIEVVHIGGDCKDPTMDRKTRKPKVKMPPLSSPSLDERNTGSPRSPNGC
jgi:hypothetical protein